jgi:hypothetical protein
MKDHPYLLKWLMLPLSLLALASFTGSYFLIGLSHDLLVNLTATFIGSILTVAYIDKVLERRNELRWAGLRSRAARRLFLFANSYITAVRVAIEISSDVIDNDEEPSQDLRIMRTRMIRVVDQVLPPNISRIRQMSVDGWQRLSTSLGASSEMGDRLLGLFGKNFAPRINELILDIQNASQSVVSTYAIWPDLLGVPADELPRRRDGSSTLSLQLANYRIVELNSVKLLKLCGELLGSLDDLPSEVE